MNLNLNTAAARQLPLVLLVGGPYDARVLTAHRRVEVGSTIEMASGQAEPVHAYRIETMGTATYLGVIDDCDTEGMVETYLSAPAPDPTK